MSIKHAKCGGRHESLASLKECEASFTRTQPPATKGEALPAWATDPASEAQRAFLLRLDKERDCSDVNVADVLMNVMDNKPISKREATQAINTLLDSPRKNAAAKAVDPNLFPPREVVPSGRYAIDGDDGKLRFYRIDRPETGAWAGWVFVKQLIGSPGSLQESRVRGPAAIAVTRAVEKDGAKEAAVRFGLELGICSSCGSPLTNEESRLAGIGPVCARKRGW